MALASALVGRWFLRALNADAGSWVSQLLVGAGLYGTAVGLLAHFPANYPGVYGIALAVPLVAARKLLWQWLIDAQQWISRLQPPEDRTSRWLEIMISAIALLHFTVALMPEVGHDALATHLFVPGHLALRHEWGFDVTTYVWAVMPMLGDWLFSIGYMFAGETAARMINVGFIFILCWLIRELVMWAGGSTIGARWASLIFLTTPLTFTESSSLFIESVWASFVVAGSLAVFKLLTPRDEKSNHYPAAGALLGGALAAKAVTFTILPVLALFLVLRFRTWARLDLIRPISSGVFLLSAIGAIPYVTAWIFTGNPFFPFFNQIFHSQFWPAVAFDTPAIFGRGLHWDAMYQATFHTEKFLEARSGAPGFQWILLFTPALLTALAFRRRRAGFLFLVATLTIAVTFQSVSYLRYVFPSFALISAGIGVSMSAGITLSAFARGLLCCGGIVAVILNLAFFNSGTYYGDLYLQPLTSDSGREDYLSNRLPIRNAVTLINHLNSGHTPVAVFSSPLIGGMKSDVLIPNWYNYQFQALVAAAQSPKEIAQLLLDKGVNYIILDNNWGAPQKREAITGATDKVMEQGSITVRRVKSDYLFQTELLLNPDFSALGGWSFSSAENNKTLGQARVTVSSAATQVVLVIAGRHYQNSVTVVCTDLPSQGRLQVNWLDSKSNFINTNIQVFECGADELTHVMDVVAPRNASVAIVYASGHINTPVIFKKVSFKQ
jgi:hypothetical protein